MVTKAKIKAIAPWFGGKRTLAPVIVELLGKHTQFFEPFCGSLAIILAKPMSQKETVNDLHGDLINLARVLQHLPAAEALYDHLQHVLFSQDLLEEARKHLERKFSVPETPTPASMERAYWYFLASWMGRNGTAGTSRVDYQIAVRWTKRGGSPTVRFKNALESIPAWHARLLNVVILQRDAFSILDRFEDCKETAIYCDPPYHAGSRSSASSSGKYLHEFDHEQGMFGDDHTRLADMLKQYKNARIVVSYYDHPRIRVLYEGWRFHEHTMLKNLHNQNAGSTAPKEAPEVLITNF